MDCNTASMLATFFGRGGTELAADDAAALNAHLATCPQCAASIQRERAFDDRIAKAMLAVPVPSNLKAKLLDQATTQTTAKVRHKAYAAAGVVVVLLAAVGGVIGYQILSAPTLDLNTVLTDEDEKARDPQHYVHRLLADQGVTFDPEQRFDMNMLASVGRERLQGKEVPTLKFVNARKNSWAKVFIVRANQFDWGNLPKNGATVQSIEGFGHQAVIIPHVQRGDTAYVVIFTGDSLELFLENNSSLR